MNRKKSVPKSRRIALARFAVLAEHTRGFSTRGTFCRNFVNRFLNRRLVNKKKRLIPMKKLISVSLAALFLILNCFTPCGSGVARAQALIELRGTVVDETNAYIPAAPLLLEDGQGQKYTTTADDHGRYRFAVKPGQYTLTVVVEGFANFTQQIDLTSKIAAPFDVKLKVALAEKVEVTDNSASISTEPDKNLSAITLTEKDLQALPDDPDELLQTLKQMAGAAGGGDDAAVYVGGFRERGQLPPKEAILRININQNPYSAEYSERGDTRIEIITKPGSDTFHGGFNFSFNDESLNARDAFAGFRAPFQYRNYGGYFSGPLIHNRWGFFFDMQRNEIDGNDFVNAIVLDPLTFLPTPFSTTVLSPTRRTNYSIRTDYLATKQHTIGLQFRHSESESIGAGGGFSLSERGSTSSSSENTLRLSLTTIASEHAVNEMRIQVSHRESMTRALSNGIAINVLDAFNGGSSQSFSDNSNRNLDITDTATYTHKNHTFKTGFRAEAVQPNNLSRSNFGGTFTFGQDFERDAGGNVLTGTNGAPIPISPIELYSRVVRGVPGYHPSQFSINTGDPFIGFSQWQYGWFAQDDWKVSKRFFVSYGVRHEFQTHLQDRLNFAPRFSFAWNADKAGKSTIRGGGGIFYTYLDSGLTAELIRLDGGHQRNFVVQQPNFFPNVPAGIESGSTTRLPTTRRKELGINDPYTMIGSVSYERQLPLKLFGSVGYTWNRGVHLLRSRNINAPLGFDDKGHGIVPFPGEGPILEYESNGLSIRHQMNINVRTGFSQKFTLFTGYTLATTHNNTDGANSNPANPYDLSTEWGRANGDFRHNLFLGGQYTAPWGLRLTPFITARSGGPFNIITGRDNNGDNQYTDRPAFAAAGDPGAVITRFGVFNPTPLPGVQIIPRNFGQGPGLVSVNLGLSKTFGFGPAPNNFRSATATTNTGANGDQQNGQTNAQGNQRGNRVATQNRGGNTQNQNRGGGGAGFAGGGGQMVMRGGGGGGPNVMMGGGDTRHKYNLTFSINASDIFNHVNFGPYNGVLTSTLFGVANRTAPSGFGGGAFGGGGGAGSRRIDVSMRFNF